MLHTHSHNGWIGCKEKKMKLMYLKHCMNNTARKQEWPSILIQYSMQFSSLPLSYLYHECVYSTYYRVRVECVCMYGYPGKWSEGFVPPFLRGRDEGTLSEVGADYASPPLPSHFVLSEMPPACIAPHRALLALPSLLACLLARLVWIWLHPKCKKRRRRHLIWP